MNQEEARRQIVTTYLAAGNISQVARLWQTSRNVVRKWVRRFEDEGEEGITISPHTLRHILNRYGFKGREKPRKVFYPAHWGWKQDMPFSLAQVDTKDILDKGTLGAKLWTYNSLLAQYPK